MEDIPIISSDYGINLVWLTILDLRYQFCKSWGEIYPPPPLYSFFDNKKIKLQNITFGKESIKGETLLKRTDIDTKEIKQAINIDKDRSGFLERLITECRYQGYIDKQQREIKNNIKNTKTKIPKNISYRDVIGLSNENIERLEKNQPANLGAAAMLEGITPASINLLRIFITKHKNAQKSRTSWCLYRTFT